MWQKFKAGLRNFMSGRNGADQLSFALLISGIILSLLSTLLRFGLLYYVGLAAYIWAIFRMFSRNVVKRREENTRFINFRQNYRSSIRQFFTRLKNIKKYRYFRCPECKARLRLPRKVGEVTVTCGKCHHQFRQKA